eukprot:SAG22_NODE_689_length_7904_cov_3.365279_4_plen_269_part_00
MSHHIAPSDGAKEKRRRLCAHTGAYLAAVPALPQDRILAVLPAGDQTSPCFAARLAGIVRLTVVRQTGSGSAVVATASSSSSSTCRIGVIGGGGNGPAGGHLGSLGIRAAIPGLAEVRHFARLALGEDIVPEGVLELGLNERRTARKGTVLNTSLVEAQGKTVLTTHKPELCRPALVAVLGQLLERDLLQLLLHLEVVRKVQRMVLKQGATQTNINGSSSSKTGRHPGACNSTSTRQQTTSAKQMPINCYARPPTRTCSSCRQAGQFR